MPVVQGREYRSIDISEFKASDDGFIVEGYATTFDAPYAFGRNGMYECVRASALDGADMSDVIFQYDHQGLVMARLRNGTLRLEKDAHGLAVWADLKGSQAGRELHEAVKNGLIDRMSWAFTVPEDGWDYDPNTRTSYIVKVDKVYDVSAVSIPADEDTSLSARSYLDGVIESERQELSLRQSRALALAGARLKLLEIGR